MSTHSQNQTSARAHAIRSRFDRSRLEIITEGLVNERTAGQFTETHERTGQMASAGS